MAIAQQKDILTENSYISDSNEWVEKIYEIDEQDYVHGGLNGYSNVPHEQLANRTTFLKNVTEQIQTQIDDFKAQVANQDQLNLDTFRVLNNELKTIRQVIAELTRTSNDIDIELHNQIDLLKVSFNQVVDMLLQHKHNYAGSDTPSGDANTVKTENYTDKVQVLGIDTNISNEVKRINGIFAENDKLYAKTVISDLSGNATSADHLKNTINISLTGDVNGLINTNFSSAVNINTSLKELDSLNNLNINNKGTHFGPSEEYNDNGDHLLNIKLDGDVKEFYVPSYVVNNKGLILESYNHKIILPDVSKSSTAGALNNTNKLYLVGALDQNEIETTYTQSKVYMSNNKLYSNNYEVIDSDSSQKLFNKTYNGYTLADACAHEVDNTVGGTVGSSKLITSNAVALHKHKYALSKTENGPAAGVDINVDNKNVLFPVVADVNSDQLKLNTTITMSNSTIKVDNLYVDSNLTIPGGQLWIDTAVDANNTSAGILADNTVKYDDTELRRSFSEVLDEVDDLRNRVNNSQTAIGNNNAQIIINKDDISDLRKSVNTNQNNINNILVNYSQNGHEHVVADIIDFPEYLPAQGGRADYAGFWWEAKCNGQEWSRICQIKPQDNRSICGILNIETHRTSVNFNTSFWIYANASDTGHVTLMQFGSGSYDNDLEFEFKALVNKDGYIYLDLKDSAGNIDYQRQELWYCNWLPFTICEIIPNTKFVNGSVTPDGYTATTVTNRKGNIICAIATNAELADEATHAASATTVSQNAMNGSTATLVSSNMANNDSFRIITGGSDDSGYVALDTADNGTEPIYVRQYTGSFSTCTRTATLLDSSGNTSFPGTVTASTFKGNLSGTAASLARSGNISVPMTFNWSGQNGQPTWLWGGNDGTNMYVYNPSNFSVNYANTAGVANAAYYNDYAEFFPRGEETEIGDIIALDENSDNEQYIKATENNICIVGVHSESFGHSVGGELPVNNIYDHDSFLKFNLPKYIPIGLIGRVPVKFIGKAKKGIQVVPSAIPGVGREYIEGKDKISNIIGYLVETDNKDDEIRLLKLKLNK